MEEIKLKEVVEIFSGIVLRRFDKSKKSLEISKQTADLRGKIYYHITLKGVEDNIIDSKLLESIKMEKEVNERYLLKKGDIVMKLTPPYSAAVVSFDCENLLAPSNFAIIRLKEEFDPEYLSFVLNGKNTRKQLQRLVEGTTVQVIKISNLKELKLRRRTITEQKKYAKLSSLLSKRLELRNRTLQIEELLTEELLLDM